MSDLRGEQGPDPVTGEIVQRLFAMVEQLRAHFELATAEFGLTPTQGLALRDLDTPLPMSRLAELLRCERSNVTLVVDRLERLGLVERQADPEDRRVRRLVLTPRGREVRTHLATQLFNQVPAVSGLEITERAQLRDLLRRVTAEAGAPPSCPGALPGEELD